MADQFQVVLLDVWREVCRHVEIEEAVTLIAPILSRCLPIRTVLVRRIDVARSCLDTIGVGTLDGSPTATTMRDTLSSDDLGRLSAWCRRETVVHGRRADGLELPSAIFPSGTQTDLLIGPLSTFDGPSGILILLAREANSFESKHKEMMTALLEPFSVALENDKRLRELAALREAAEADKRSLLIRLGRQDISDTIVGANGGLKHVMERADLVAPSDAPVLLFGETGSGKEVIARAIHARSPRASAPFLRVNCGAIPSELIDSELFGHEKGSFTGATALRKGWFERADGGTLLLDEIGELLPAAQVRLLRILQDGTFERVGGQHQLRVDVRIVAATHRNLQAMVAEGRFREDLWYRLAVFPIYLPSLRDRAEDIPEIATHFALKAARRFGLPLQTPTSDDLHLLLTYSWPGNVRELGAVMDRAVILGNGKGLEIAKALGATDHPMAPRPRSTPSRLTPDPQSEANSFPPLDAAMKQHIESALAKTRGRIEGRDGAAILLDINPHTLRARMRKLGIDWKRFR